jgi:phosphoribosyl 1,2-cyclic phosphodiesterase
MLRGGSYPVPLKRRILSGSGHLSNEDCASLACALAAGGAEHVILGHLSRENNTPRLAFDTVRRALDERGFAGVALAVAPSDGEVSVEIASCSVSN